MMNRVDAEELSMALAYLVGALPAEPKWVMLVTDQGEVIGRYRVKHDAAWTESVVDGTESLVNHFCNQLGIGALRYNISACEQGTSLTIMLGSGYLLCINLGQVKSLDAVILGTQEGMTPLMDVLGLPH